LFSFVNKFSQVKIFFVCQSHLKNVHFAQTLFSAIRKFLPELYFVLSKLKPKKQATMSLKN
jgi:hypothetical protein